jgi:CRISPR-associated protein Csy1
MEDKAITTFFEERKVTWLKNKLTTSMKEVEIREKEIECEKIFAIQQWLPNAANRAKSRAMSTHPSKFSHPSTGVGKDNRKNTTFVTPVICKSKHANDGFLRSGNIDVALDSLGNAGELDVDEFLKLILCNGQTLLAHLENDSGYIRELFSVDNLDYELIRAGLLTMTRSEGNVETSSKIKQVYFPVQEDYHLLSLLTPSGLIFELKRRCRLSEKDKTARNKETEGEFHPEGYRQIVNITVIGYGGSNPWNISLLNKDNYGQSYLLLSAPPEPVTDSV